MKLRKKQCRLDVRLYFDISISVLLKARYSLIVLKVPLIPNQSLKCFKRNLTMAAKLFDGLLLRQSCSMIPEAYRQFILAGIVQ